ncbi:hypothetical protein [Algoriphagus sp. A40]|uniref:hypothetical protein n=1 Tax=Algoriphagus sp. A40 TaxID=1945863 RepID=UPI000984651D|nr:hypothetical protein [Algoriphagus sp. A40]OOG77887.1 hypothetical protein B0E43_03755 [Algoriphagus sp. A40]
MENPKIQPDKITKPIQLLAVWFAGLVLLVGLLLTGAKTINEPIWLVPVLAISAILIIPIFLYFVFLLQTKYRPQMQEDTFYSRYLDTSTNKTVILTEESTINSTVIELQNQVIQLTESNKTYLKNIESLIKDTKSQDTKKISEIEAYIKTSNENFTKVEENIKKSQFQIKLNRLLPKFSEYRLAIVKNGFENLEEFTGGGGKLLDRALISVGMNVDPKFVLEVIKILKPLGLEIINLINNGHQQEKRKNEVVVGSHAYNNTELVTLNIDSVFIETLSNIENKELFQSMFK